MERFKISVVKDEQTYLFEVSDYPHHEGVFPHSAASIQRQMNGLTESQREKILGLNAARIFNVKHPAAVAQKA